MYYNSLELLHPLYYTTIKIDSKKLDKGLAKLLDYYIIKNQKYILKAVPYHHIYNRSIHVEYYYLKKRNDMLFIYKNKRKIVNFEDYPYTYRRINRINRLLFYKKDKLFEFCRDLYPKKHLHKFLTRKSTLFKHLYKHRSTGKYLRNI